MPHFKKMHGLGNDFVVIDCRADPRAFDVDAARMIADRRRGVGCDQLILLETPNAPDADVRLTFLNADGSRAGACGNGTRCAADLVLNETGKTFLFIETDSGCLGAWREPGGDVTVDMGIPRLSWGEIPLSRPMDTLFVPVDLSAGNIGSYELGPATCANMGNPHATFFVEDVDAIDLARIGPIVENHPLFPQRVNVGIAEILTPARIRLRVWERGAGETLACGTGACAALVAAARRGLSTRHADIVLSYGSLRVDWADDDHVLLSGPSSVAFVGEFDLVQSTTRHPASISAAGRDVS